MALTPEIKKYIDDLNSSKEEIRKRAVISLSKHNLPEVKEALSKLTNDPSTAVRYFAKKALKDFETIDAVKVQQTGGFDISDINKPKENVILSNTNVQTQTVTEQVKKENVIKSQDLQSKENVTNQTLTLTQILNKLKDPDENVKVEAIKLLGERKEVVAVEPLLSLIHSPSRNIRLYAVQSLGLIGENKVLTPLLNLLNSEQDPFVVATLVKAIARVGGSQLIPIIARYLKDPDARTRANTIEALEIIGDPKIIKFLVPLLQDENNRVRANAIKVLSKFGKTNMFEKLQEMIQSDDASTRASAIYALTAIGGDQVLDILSLAKNDSDINNLKKLADGLYKINTERSLAILKELEFHSNRELVQYVKNLINPQNESIQTKSEDLSKDIQTQSIKSSEYKTEESTLTEEIEERKESDTIQQISSVKPTEEIKTIKEEVITKTNKEVETKQQLQPKIIQSPLKTLNFSGPPCDFTQEDFENLWNDILYILYNFKKNHPNFSKEKIIALLHGLISVIK